MANEELNNTPEVELTSSDFEFVHKQGFEKIHDEKFKTKSTTYAKDAFKRFVKNKSSVVGAIIIAVLMLGSVFVPIISPYDTKAVQDQALYLLPPKLFNPGSKLGFWDGTVVRESTAEYDEETNTYYPKEIEGAGMVGVKHNAYIPGTLEIFETETYDSAGINFYGGLLKVSARTNIDYNPTSDNYFYFENRNYFSLSDTSNTKVSILMDGTDNAKENSKLGEFRIRLCAHKRKKYEDTDEIAAGSFYDLVDWTTEYPTDPENPLVLDLSGALPAGKELQYASLRIEVKPNSQYRSYILVDKVEFSCDDETYYEESLRHYNIEDCNYTALLKPEDLGCWVSNGAIDGYQMKYSKVRFRYDMYEHQLGLRRKFTVGKTDMDKYVAKGWCEYDWNVGPTSFKRLSDECPVLESDGVTEYTQSLIYLDDGTPVYQLVCDVTYYKYLGYKEMPRFVLGTDDSGRAMFTHSLRCLKNSLAVSVICCIVTITFGLIWGCISGYYGGVIDLTMERITDILVGIPGTVVLTLVLLHLGRSLFTFALAVCLTGWIGTSGLARTQMYRFKNRESVLASRTLGANDGRLIFRHILPNALGTIVTANVLRIPSFIFTEASLAFLHLGIDSGDSFGVLISNNYTNLSIRPMLTFFPVFILIFLMISFNLFGNGLRDALNPTLKGGE